MFSTILFIWQLPQCILGHILRSSAKYIHHIGDVKVYETNAIEGISLGDTILIQRDIVEGSWIIRHEFGHIIQSRLLGWLYIPVILIPSYLWYRYVDKKEKQGTHIDYYRFYTESWANRLVKP